MRTPINMAKKANSRVTGSAVPIRVLTALTRDERDPEVAGERACSQEKYC